MQAVTLVCQAKGVSWRHWLFVIGVCAYQGTIEVDCLYNGVQYYEIALNSRRILLLQCINRQ